MILQFVDGLRGEVHVTCEEGTWAAWLDDLLKPHVTRLVVCDPAAPLFRGDTKEGLCRCSRQFRPNVPTAPSYPITAEKASTGPCWP